MTRRRLEREAEKNAAERERGELQARAELYGRIQYPATVLGRYVPAGDSPIASRYDPRTDTVHIATASGKVIQIERSKIAGGPPPERPGEVRITDDLLRDQRDLMKELFDKIQRGGGEAPQPLASKPEQEAQDKLEEAWGRFQAERMREWAREQMEAEQRRRECRCAPPGEGSPDAQPCPQHPHGGGRDGQPGEKPQPPPKTPSLSEQWEIAEGRCAEWLIHTGRGRNCECKGDCGLGHQPYPNVEPDTRASHSNDGTILLMPAYGVWHTDVYKDGECPAVLCERCARRVVAANPLLLDWNPEG